MRCSGHLSERLGDASHESFSLAFPCERFCAFQTHPWSIRSSQFGKLNFRICSGKSEMNRDTPGGPGSTTCRAPGNSLSCFPAPGAAHRVSFVSAFLLLRVDAQMLKGRDNKDCSASKLSPAFLSQHLCFPLSCGEKPRVCVSASWSEPSQRPIKALGNLF